LVVGCFPFGWGNRVNSYSEPGKSQSFGYDAFGNLWQSGTALGVPDMRPNSSSWYLLADNSVSNRLSGTAYDTAGNQTQLSIAAGTSAAYRDAIHPTE
jgi:hypothetical protein